MSDTLKDHKGDIEAQRALARLPSGQGWSRGLPTVAQVVEHLAMHGWSDRDDRFAGLAAHVALWAFWDSEQWMGVPNATNIRLKLAELRDVQHGVSVAVSEGEVVLQNGHTFWQSLASTGWAERSFWRPVTREGFAVNA